MKIPQLFNWLIDFNGMTACLVLFYAKRLENIFLSFLFLTFLCIFILFLYTAS